MIAKALFDVLETQALLASSGLEVSVLAPGVPFLLAAGGNTGPARQ
jgi:hypothetical protein